MIREGYSKIWQLEKLGDGWVGGCGWGWVSGVGVGGWVGGWFLLVIRIGRANQLQLPVTAGDL